MSVVTLPDTGGKIEVKTHSTDTRVQVMVAARFPFSVTASAMTRPANTTAYAAGDAIANNATAGSVTPVAFACSDVSGQPVRVTRIVARTTDTGLVNRTIRVCLYKGSSAPTAVSGDNAAFTPPAPADLIGTFTGTFFAADGGAIAFLTPEYGADLSAFPTAQTLWGLIQAVDGFTPSANSTTVTLTAEGYQERTGT